MLLGGAGFNLLVSPDGGNVYVSSASNDAIVTFDRNPDTGAVTRVPKPAGCISEGGRGGCRRGHEFSVHDLAISPDGRNVYGLGEIYPKVGVVQVLDRRPDGSLVQKPGRAGCFGGNGFKHCVGETPGEVRGITVSPDGKYVYIYQYTFAGGRPLLRHPSGRLSELPSH